jgi:hypothetical protein
MASFSFLQLFSFKLGIFLLYPPRLLKFVSHKPPIPFRQTLFCRRRRRPEAVKHLDNSLRSIIGEEKI